MVENAIQISVFALLAILSLFPLLRYCKNCFSHESSVNAEVVDKDSHTIRSFRFAKTTTKYIVSFRADGKVLKFFTSFWTYDAVRIGERGVLRYKGNIFIKFK